MKKLLTIVLTGILLAAGLTSCALNDSSASGRTVLKISFQDTAFPALIEASGVLDGADYEVEWQLLTGPAANFQALYSGAIDLGHMGDTSLTIEQANASMEWTSDNAPLKIVAGWRNGYDQKYAPLVTAARTSAGIDNIDETGGHSWAYNFGGYNHAQYLVSLVEAGLTESDIDPKQFADSAGSAAAFNSGEVDVYSGGQGAIISSLTSGDAKTLLTEKDTGVPAMHVWTATKQVLEDDAKDAALKDFFDRLSGYWAWHDANPEQVKEILKAELKIDDLRADFEYEVRRGPFRAFDGDLMDQEQAVAQTLYDGEAIDKLPEVSIEFDPRYNDVQQAISTSNAEAMR